MLTDANGIARATLVLGDKAGTYSVRVKSPRSLTGATADFTATAIKPATVAILKDSLDPTFKASAYAIRSDGSTSFFMAGFDAQGAMIGPIKAGWSVGTTPRGDNAPKTDSTSTVFTPTGVAGYVALSADPVVAGLSTIKADLFITKLYVSVQNNFVPSAPVDDSAKFVPGMYLDGTNVALDVMKATGQFISLHILTGTAKGTATFTVDSTSYPGIAMNYPLNGDTSKDMQFTNGLQTITKSFDTSTGDTWVTLLIRDFGASGTIKVSIVSGRPTYTLPPLKLPVDADGNGLPDAKWSDGTTTLVDPVGLAAASDLDDDGNSSTPYPGDGLSAYEEMRGIVQGELFTRLNPRRRDLFLVIDPSFFIIPESPFSRLASLPVLQHYLEEDEVVGENYAPRAMTTTKPVINPNRAGVPGARLTGQRAVRLIRQDQFFPIFPRTSYATGDTVNVPAWRAGVFGQTILDAQNPNAPEDSQPPGGYKAQSPNETRSVEVYERSYVSVGIHTEFPFLDTGYYDQNGNPTAPCLSAGNPSNCDDFNLRLHMILPFELGKTFWDELHTIPSYAEDYYTIPGRTCEFPNDKFDGGFSTDYIAWQRGAVAAHEIGHAVHIDHNFVCGTMMSDRIPDTAPPPTQFIAAERDAVRLRQ